MNDRLLDGQRGAPAHPDAEAGAETAPGPAGARPAGPAAPEAAGADLPAAAEPPAAAGPEDATGDGGDGARGDDRLKLDAPLTGVEVPQGSAVRTSVRGWLLLAFALLGVLAVAAAVIGSVLLGRTAAAADRLVDRVEPAGRAAADMRAALLEQASGVRGYLLTGDRAALASYTGGQADERRAAAVITRSLGSDRTAAADLAAVERAAAAWRSGYAAPAVARGPGAPGPGGDAGELLFARVGTGLAAQSGHLDRVRVQVEAELHRIRHQRDDAFLALVVLLLVLGGGTALVLQRSVARPLDAIRLAATEVANGDLRRRIPDEGPADLRAVALAVEAMRARVVADLDASVEQKEVLRAQSEALDAQAVELRRSNADLEQFAYVASHDLQEPLRKVASFCQLLEKRYAEQLDDRARQYIAFAVDGAKRMQVLINDLLAYSRVGRMSEGDRAVRTDEVLDRALDNLSAAVEEGAAEIERPPALPEVLGDRTLVGMLWQNLLGNAVKFRAPERPPRIRISAEPDPEEPGMVRFAVADNGIGIPHEFAEKVFVIFQRLNGRDQYEGTGIGLALCKKIVEYSGGRIRLDPEHRPGTRVVFTLPAAPDAEGGGTPPA